MIFVGIDVAKDKHDCFIISSEGEVLADVFTITNSKEGFEHLLQTINTCTGIGVSKIKVGLEATGHYSYNLLGFRNIIRQSFQKGRRLILTKS